MMRASRVLTLVALGLAALFVTLGSLFAAGYAFEDPGGFAAAGLVLLWVVPVAVLSLVAALWPRPAVWVLGAGLVIVAVTSFSFAISTTWWRDLMDEVGPVLGILAFVLILPLAVLGVQRQLAAGLMLAALAVIPYVAFLFTITDEPWQGLGASLTTSSTVSTVPVLVIAALYLLAALLGRGRPAPEPPPAAGPSPRREEMTKVA